MTGFKVLWFQGDTVFDEEDVVAFDGIRPITAAGVLADRDELDAEYALLHPDGHIETEDGEFSSLESFDQFLDDTGMPGIVAEGRAS
jgi:hypothetical protein